MDNTKELDDMKKRKNTNNNDKLDTTRFSSLTRELIRRKFITDSDFDIFRYDELFNDLLSQYEFKIVLIATSYTVSQMKSRRFRDETGDEIVHRFKYFETAVLNSIHKLTTPITWDLYDND